MRQLQFVIPKGIPPRAFGRFIRYKKRERDSENRYISENRKQAFCQPREMPQAAPEMI